jgi:hypothetical protein
MLVSSLILKPWRLNRHVSPKASVDMALHHRGQNSSQLKWRFQMCGICGGNKLGCCFPTFYITWSFPTRLTSTLKMKAVCLYKTLVTMYHTIRCQLMRLQSKYFANFSTKSISLGGWGRWVKLTTYLYLQECMVLHRYFRKSSQRCA